MTATYHPIETAPKFAPDARAVVRIISAMGSYRHYYVDGRADARALCREIGAELTA